VSLAAQARLRRARPDRDRYRDTHRCSWCGTYKAATTVGVWRMTPSATICPLCAELAQRIIDAEGAGS